MIVESPNADSSYAVAADDLPLGRLTCFNSMRSEYSNHYGTNFKHIAGYM